eukprot:9504116-Pyramimonas_sp.AAC.5
MSRESLCVPLDETNISALLGYLHQGINSLEDIASAYEWAGRYPGRYKKKETGACMGQVDHGTPTKPCEGKDLGASPSSDIGASPSSGSGSSPCSGSGASPSGGTILEQLRRCSSSGAPVGAPSQQWRLSATHGA